MIILFYILNIESWVLFGKFGNEFNLFKYLIIFWDKLVFLFKFFFDKNGLLLWVLIICFVMFLLSLGIDMNGGISVLFLMINLNVWFFFKLIGCIW